nr:amidohydrolase family protein [Xanthomonas nasturtii]
MQAHVEGGMTPAEVLQAATLGGARSIGRGAELGSLEAGKLADLVILQADPRLDIGNAQKIDAVMLGGRLREVPSLDELWPRETRIPPLWQRGESQN